MVATVVIGLAVGLIVTRGSKADVVEMSPASCQDRVVTLDVSNTCPNGTYLEYASDNNGGRYIICHCEQPLPPIQVQLPNLGDVPLPSVPEKPRPIEL